MPWGEAIAAFAPDVRALQNPNLEGEGVAQNGLETQHNVKQFLKRPGPLPGCCVHWALRRGEKAQACFSLLSLDTQTCSNCTGSPQAQASCVCVGRPGQLALPPGGYVAWSLSSPKPAHLQDSCSHIWKWNIGCDDMRAEMWCFPEIRWGLKQWKIYFCVRTFAVKNLRVGMGGRSLLTISKCSWHWNRMLANKDKPYFFSSIWTLLNNNSILMVLSLFLHAWLPVKQFHAGKKTQHHWPWGSYTFLLLW